MQIAKWSGRAAALLSYGALVAAASEYYLIRGNLLWIQLGVFVVLNGFVFILRKTTRTFTVADIATHHLSSLGEPRASRRAQWIDMSYNLLPLSMAAGLWFELSGTGWQTGSKMILEVVAGVFLIQLAAVLLLAGTAAVWAVKGKRSQS